MSGGGGSDGSSRPTPIKPVQLPKGKGGGAGGGGGNIPDECLLVDNTILNSPNPAVVPTLSVGSTLDVVLQPGPPVRVVVVTTAGQVAGAITSAKLPQMTVCLEAGVEYKAEVTAIRGGTVRVRISNK